MHINDSLCPPPCNGGWGRGEVPPPSCREREVNVYQSYCQMPCGHGVGNGGGSTAPVFLALVSLYQVTMVEPGDWRP